MILMFLPRYVQPCLDDGTPRESGECQRRRPLGGESLPAVIMKWARFWLALALGAVSFSGPVAAAPTPPRAPAAIQSLDHNARRPLNVGDRFAVTLGGTGGGTAVFHLTGVVTDVGMREVRAGAYQLQASTYLGAYVVGRGDEVLDSALLATLTVERQVTAAARRPITIDTRPPVVLARFPKPGAALPNLRPNIAVQYDDRTTGINPGTVRIAVNGQDVTRQAAVSNTAATYNPPVPFRPGPVRVQMAAADRNGNAVQTQWAFTLISPAGLIQSVTINPAVPLQRGDVLTVVMTGEAGGRASFLIPGLPAVSMRETRTAGQYLGTFAVVPGLILVDAPVTVTLDKGGRRNSVAASVGVTILSVGPAAPEIRSASLAELPGGRGTRLILRGRSRPGYRIRGQVAMVPGFFGPDPQLLVEFSSMVDGNGSWLATVAPLVTLGAARMVVTIVAEDPAGQRSTPSRVELP